MTASGTPILSYWTWMMQYGNREVFVYQWNGGTTWGAGPGTTGSGNFTNTRLGSYMGRFLTSRTGTNFMVWLDGAAEKQVYVSQVP